MTSRDAAFLVTALTDTVWHVALLALVTTCLSGLVWLWVQDGGSGAGSEATPEASSESRDRAIDSACASGGRWL